jgi:hypothetical protein
MHILRPGDKIIVLGKLYSFNLFLADLTSDKEKYLKLFSLKRM